MASKKWLEVSVEEEITPLHGMPHCLTLCDLTYDRYTCLVVVDLSPDIVPTATLKVLRGTKMVFERQLEGLPCAICSLYPDCSELRTPIIAVAIGYEVFFFRNLKPHFKYTVPVLEVEDLEKTLWLKLPLIKVEQQADVMEKLRSIDFCRLTIKTQRLLKIRDDTERQEFIRKYGEAVLERRSRIVTMNKLERVSNCEQEPSSYLVLGTSNGNILILEVKGFSIVYEAKTTCYDTTPSLMAVHGTFETDFYLIIATRDGSIYLLRKSFTVGQEICKLSEPATDMIHLPVEQTIMVSCISKRLMCYSKKGKQLYVHNLPARPMCLLPIALMHLGMTLTCVALEGGAVQFYLQRHLVDELTVNSTVIAMCFGQTGLEENVLTLLTKNGNVIIKILKRQAIFETSLKSIYGNHEQQILKQNKVLDKSKKTSIFVEQANREKQNAKETYGAFQASLWRLRHLAARKTVETMKSNETSLSIGGNHAQIKLTAELSGLGPEFCLNLIVHNMSNNKLAFHLTILLHADRTNFKLPKTKLNLPTILSQKSLHVDFQLSINLDSINKLSPNTLPAKNSNRFYQFLKWKEAPEMGDGLNSKKIVWFGSKG